MNNSGLAYFTDSVNKLIEGKLILVDKNIASVLKCVATVPTLCKTLANVARTTTYVTEFSRARVTWTRPDGTVEARLKLPVERNRLFSFVVCLLAEVDSGRRNFLEFLKEYYHETDNNIGYERFANEVLKPFKQAGEMILRSEDPASFNEETFGRAERYFNLEKIYIDSSLCAQMLQQVQQISASLNSSANAPQSVKDIASACEYFTNALHLKNPRILGVSWLALKSLLQQQRVFDDNLKVLSQLMAGISIV